MIVVVADDITGAAEIAGKAMEFGLSVEFHCTSDGRFSVNTLVEVVIIATNSRSLSEAESIKLHQQLVAGISQLQHSATIHFFKKCDSVLRGYVLSELLPLAELTGRKKLILQPANPAAGRCIHNGNYTVNKLALHHTAFKDDPDFPATTSSVTQLLELRNPAFQSRPAFEYLLSDCSSEEEMQDQLKRSDFSACMYAGSTAFFGNYLTIIHHLRAKPAKHTTPYPVTGPFLLIAGSAHATTTETLQQFETRGRMIIQLPEELRQPECSFETIQQLAVKKAEQWKNAPNDGILLLTGGKQETFESAAEVLNQRLCTIAQLLVSHLQIKSIFISGGATTWQFIRETNRTTLIPEKTLAPGVIQLRVAETPDTTITIKPGSYPWGIEF